MPDDRPTDRDPGPDAGIVRTHVAREDRSRPVDADGAQDAAARDASRAAALDPAAARREGAYADPTAAEGAAPPGIGGGAAPAAGDPTADSGNASLGASATGAAMAAGTGHGAAGHAAMAGTHGAAEPAPAGRAREDRAGSDRPASRAEARARLLTTALPFGWKGLLGFGILTALGGIAAILTPFLASLTVAAFAAATFVILGAATLWMAFKGDEMVVPHRLMNGAIGALMIVFGVLLFANPLAGLLSLTILVAAFFVAEGAMRVWLGIKSRGARDGAGWLIAGGAISILLGVMVFLGLPATSIFVLGLFLGIDLLGTGIAMIALSFAERKATGDRAPA